MSSATPTDPSATAEAAPPSRPDGRRERWREHRELRREELVAAVIAAVRAEGAGVGMEDIAEHSGIAKQIFYRYFSDKADLHAATGQVLAGIVVRDIAAAVADASGPRAMLAAGITRYLELVDADVELYRFVMRPAAAERRGRSEQPERPHPVSAFETVVGLHVTRLIGDRLRASGNDAGAAEPYSFALVGAARSATDRWLVTQSMTRDALADYLTEFAWSGLAATEASTKQKRSDH